MSALNRKGDGLLTAPKTFEKLSMPEDITVYIIPGGVARTGLRPILRQPHHAPESSLLYWRQLGTESQEGW